MLLVPNGPCAQLPLFAALPRSAIRNRSPFAFPTYLCIQQRNSYSLSSLVYVHSQYNACQLSHQEAWHMLLLALFHHEKEKGLCIPLASYPGPYHFVGGGCGRGLGTRLTFPFWFSTFPTSCSNKTFRTG